MSGWIKPPNPSVEAEYWLTCRSADAAPGYDLGLPDIRVRYRWVPDREVWITGYYEDGQAELCCFHSNNGWRLLRLIEAQSP
jgi:hypothetical protein